MEHAENYSNDRDSVDKEESAGSSSSSEEKEASIDSQNLCVVCKQREKDFSENSKSVLCKECREEHIRLKIPPRIIGFLAVIFIIFIASLVELPTTFSSFRIYVNAGKHMKAHEYISAFEDYTSLLDTYGESTPIIIKACDAAIGAQHFDGLAEIYNTYLFGRNFDEANYKRVTGYYDFLMRYYTASDEIGAIMERLTAELPDENVSDEQLAWYYSSFRAELTSLLNRDDLDKSLIYYYLGNLSEDDSTRLKYFKLGSEQDIRVTYINSYYGGALRRLGRLDEARQVFENALVLNAEDALSLRGLSIVELLEGNKERSLATMRRAHELAPYGLYIPEAMIIALHENGLTDEADALLEQLVSEGFVIDGVFQDYLDGKVSVDAYYMK